MVLFIYRSNSFGKDGVCASRWDAGIQCCWAVFNLSQGRVDEVRTNPNFGVNFCAYCVYYWILCKCIAVRWRSYSSSREQVAIDRRKTHTSCIKLLELKSETNPSSSSGWPDSVCNTEHRCAKLATQKIKKISLFSFTYSIYMSCAKTCRYWYFILVYMTFMIHITFCQTFAQNLNEHP